MADEYSFLQETIKDEAGSRKMRRKKVLKIVGFAFLFGIVASFAFFASKPWIEDMFGSSPEKVTIPEDEAQAEEENEIVIPETEDSYRKMLNDLNGISRTVSRSMVAISNVQESKDISGTIVADNGKELLIFASATDEGKNDLSVTFFDGKSYAASVKKQDSNLGFAIYAVEIDEIEKETWDQIETVKLGNSNLVQAGDSIIVLGKSFAGTDVVSYGIAASTEERKEAVDGYFRLIRADVGGSDIKDGFLISTEGQLIGAINSLDEESPNKMLVTAYSISDIKKEIERMSNGHGVPYLGLYGAEITEEMIANAEQEIPQGIYVKEIEADSPAVESGIQMGDIITQVGEAKVANLQEYRSALLQYYPGQQVVLKGSRIGAEDQYVEIEFTLVVTTKE